MITQGVADEFQLPAGRGRDRDVMPASLGDPVPELAQVRGFDRRCTDSTAAQRTRREPCLVIRPRRTLVSDSWCLGVIPAQQVSWTPSQTG
jgi:hypothetical protein